MPREGGYLPAAEGGGVVVGGEERRRISRYLRYFVNQHPGTGHHCTKTTIAAYWFPFLTVWNRFRLRLEIFNYKVFQRPWSLVIWIHNTL